MITKTIRIVSFNGNEEEAVDRLFEDLLSAGPWTESHSPDRPGREIGREAGADLWELEHVAFGAQGNVMAATALANFTVDQRTRRPQAVLVFYGCAGIPKVADVGSVFLVRSTSYMSLGKAWNEPLANPGGTWVERITIASKWLVEVPGDDGPLSPLSLTGVVGPAAIGRAGKYPWTMAHVAATDKVVEVDVGEDPAPAGASTLTNDRWTFSDTLAHIQASVLPLPVIVDMESFGIARMAYALGVAERVAIMRVATDALSDKSGTATSQGVLLADARPVLAAMLYALLTGRRA